METNGSHHLHFKNKEVISFFNEKLKKDFEYGISTLKSHSRLFGVKVRKPRSFKAVRRKTVIKITVKDG